MTRFTLADLRAVRKTGEKVAMLTCYDFTTARLMADAGVRAILVGDSAGNVILGHDSTIPVPLSFMIQITAAVRRGAPEAFLVADMPFGSYHRSVAQGVGNVVRMVQQTGCDAVKLEVAAGQVRLVRALADAGVAVVAHVGLRPQSVGRLGGYRYQGRTADEAAEIILLAQEMTQAGAAALLVEATPPAVARAVVDRCEVPVIGCGAGQHCHGFVVVTHDLLSLTPRQPRFAPALADLASPFKQVFSTWVQQISRGEYPAPAYDYPMDPGEELVLDRALDDSNEAD